MKYVYDHDLHIHSTCSLCAKDPEQTTENILKYAKENNLKTICLTDHFWDETVEGASNWYSRQDYAHILTAKPLPEADGVRFMFGCETELDKFMTVGLAREHFDRFDFVIIPTTHFHMKGFTMSEADTADAKSRAEAWCRRLDGVLSMDLPFHKIGIAHLTCGLISPTREEYREVLSLLPEDEMERIFTKAATLGVGIEINQFDMSYAEEEKELVLRPYRIAKKCGCKFYCGSDAHSPTHFETMKDLMEKGIAALGLTEEDKFII